MEIIQVTANSAGPLDGNAFEDGEAPPGEPARALSPSAMGTPVLATIPIASVDAGNRLRAIDAAHLIAILDSVAEVGLLNPITVYRQESVDGHGYGLIAGLHRLEACRRLGFTDIPAHIIGLSELQRQIAECDENLCGPNLTPADRAR